MVAKNHAATVGSGDVIAGCSTENDVRVLAGTDVVRTAVVDGKRGCGQQKSCDIERRMTVVAGTGTYDTKESIALTEAAADAGVDAVMAVTPYYSRPPQRGIAAHMRAIAEARKRCAMKGDDEMGAGLTGNGG